MCPGNVSQWCSAQSKQTRWVILEGWNEWTVRTWSSKRSPAAWARAKMSNIPPTEWGWYSFHSSTCVLWNDICFCNAVRYSGLFLEHPKKWEQTGDHRNAKSATWRWLGTLQVSCEGWVLQQTFQFSIFRPTKRDWRWSFALQMQLISSASILSHALVHLVTALATALTVQRMSGATSSVQVQASNFDLSAHWSEVTDDLLTLWMQLVVINTRRFRLLQLRRRLVGHFTLPVWRWPFVACHAT